jgi:RND family efflux transporter MFP subunit
MLDADLAVQIADAQQGLAEVRAEQNKAQAARTAMEYPHSTDPLIIEQAWVHYELARREHTQALKAYEKVKDRPRLNEARIQALDALISAEMAMDEALALYNWYTGFATETQIAQADARIAVAEAAVWQAETELAALQEQEAGHVLSAPTDGVVLDVLVEPGQTVGLETAAIVFADPLALEGWTTVIEEDIRLVQIGQTAELYIDALPEVSMTGTVSRILPRRIADEDRPLYYVILHLSEIPGELFDGMNLDAAIVIDTRDDVLRLPRSVIRSAANGDPMVLVWENGQEIERLVEVGLQGDLYVEILDGLSEGEQVIAR